MWGLLNEEDRLKKSTSESSKSSQEFMNRRKIRIAMKECYFQNKKITKGYIKVNGINKKIIINKGTIFKKINGMEESKG